MNSVFRKSGYLAFIASLALASGALAQTAQITLTGVGDAATVTTPNYGGVYVDPYTATVNGVQNVSVICDDCSNNSYVNESWTANVTTIGALNSGTNTNTPMFGNNAALYNELAWLGTQLLANPTNYANQVAVSFALWELTYGVNGTAVETPDPTTFLAASNASSYAGAVSNLLTTAATVVAGGYQGTGWEILTPIGSTVVPEDEGVPQEFLVHTPESSSVIMLAADMFGVLALAFFFRKRIALPVLN